MRTTLDLDDTVLAELRRRQQREGRSLGLRPSQMPLRWHPDGMETTIDRAGRIVVHKALRDSLGLSAGTRVEITASGDGLVLRPVGPKTRVVHRHGRPVLDAEGPVEPLDAETVRDLVERGRL